MKKILLPATASGIKSEVLDFAAYIGKLQRSQLVGLFIEESGEIAPSLHPFEGQIHVETQRLAAGSNTQKPGQTSASIAMFRNGCMEREVHCHVHRAEGDTFANIIAESRYSDIMVLDASISVFGDDTIPSSLALDILHKAECPVLIAPEVFEEPNQVILAYDEGYSSAFAIKQFCLQLPALTAKNTIALHIHDNDGVSGSPGIDSFREWISMHFSNISFIELHGDPREELFKYFLQNNPKNDKMLVAGAFGRSYLSSLFKPATADLVVKAIDMPIFITHL